MKDRLTLQRDIHIKMMNKLLPTFTTDHYRIYNFGHTVVSCKVKVKRVRKYVYPPILNPLGAIYELDIIVSDVVYHNFNGNTYDPKLFIRENKRSYNKGLRWFGKYNIEKYINMIDSNPMSISISKIEYNL